MIKRHILPTVYAVFSLLVVALVTAVLLAPRELQAQMDQRNWGGTSTGPANAQVVGVANYRRSVGIPVMFMPGTANTSNTTLNVNGTGVAALKRATNVGVQELVGGELVTTAPVTVMWTGTYYTIMNRYDIVGSAINLRNHGVGVTAVPGYVIEDGSCVSQTGAQYVALFAAISTDYGSCSAGNFALPDSRGRSDFAIDTQGSNGAASRLTSGGSGCAGNVAGTGCGIQSVSLSVANLQSFTPTGSVAAFNPASSINAFTPTGTVSIFSGGHPVNFIGNNGVNLDCCSAAGNSFALQATSAAFTGNGIVLTGGNQQPAWTGNAIGSGQSTALIPPLLTSYRAIKL